GVVVEGRSVEAPLEPRGVDVGTRGADRPHEHQRLGGEERDRGGGEAREDVAHAGAGRDHREDALALEQVEVLGDAAPGLQHHDLERDRVDDVGGEGDGRALVDLVRDVDGDGGDDVGGE